MIRETICAIRKIRDLGSCELLGIVEQLVKSLGQMVDSVLLSQLPERSLSYVTGCQLRSQISQHVPWDSDIAVDDVENGLNGFPRFVELERRDAQPFLVDLRGITGVSPGDSTADVCVMGNGGEKAQEFFIQEHRLVQVYIRQMCSAFIGGIEDEEVAFVDVRFIFVENGDHSVRETAQMKRDAKPL